MRGYPCLFIAIFVLMILLTPGRSAAIDAADEKEAVIERVIKIEGTVEKPRVIFIVPKAKLWSGSITDKSYRDEFLKPLYPDDAAFKEITTGK
ncbi:MAG: hypothetical protein WA162_02405 [Thermodesulfobacteriota bacterium]